MSQLATMLRSSLLAVLAITLVALPSPAIARTVGVSAADTAVFNYTIFTTYATPNGNHTTTQLNRMAVRVTSVDVSKPLGEIGYSETITILNGTSITSGSPINNYTAVFNPFDNRTYLGRIGFYPFTYTDLNAGTAENMNVSLTITGTGAGDITGTQRIDSIVARAPGVININFTISPGAQLPPSLTVMKFNATTGVLIRGVTYTHFFGVEKDFIYDLVTYTGPGPIPGQDYTYVWVGLLAVVVIIAVFAVLRRPSARERKAARMRRKLTRTVLVLQARMA